MRILFALCLSFTFTLFSANALAQEWYEGGDLHTATVAQWKSATAHNKVATCADWVHVTTDKATIAQITREQPETLRNLALFLSACVTKSAEGATPNMNASTLAVLCLATFKEQNPELTWLLSRQ